MGSQRVSNVFGRERLIAGDLLSKAPLRNVGGGRASPAPFYSAVKSTTGNIWEQPIFLTRIAGRSRTKLKARFFDDERIVLTGQARATQAGSWRPTGSYTSNLRIQAIKLKQVVTVVQEPLPAAQVPGVGEPKAEPPSQNGVEVPSAPTAKPFVKNSSAGVADPEVPSTPAAQASVTNELPRAQDLDKYKWGAAFIVMIVWLLIVSFGKTLIRKKGMRCAPGDDHSA